MERPISPISNQNGEVLISLMPAMETVVNSLEDAREEATEIDIVENKVHDINEQMLGKAKTKQINGSDD